MDRQSRLVLRLTMRTQTICFDALVIGFFVAPLFQMNVAQDRLLFCSYFVVPLFIIETVRSLREAIGEASERRQDQSVNPPTPTTDATSKSN